MLCHPLPSFFLDPLWSQSSLASGGLFCWWTLRLIKECKFCFLQMQFYERKVKVTQSCLTLCDPMDCSLPGSSVHGIPQARILERVAILFFKGSSQHRTWTQVSHIASGSLPSDQPGKPNFMNFHFNIQSIRTVSTTLILTI